MRLPLRHPPPSASIPPLRCAHLEALVDALVGVPLGPATDLLTSRRSRGRHGNALQWHFGLAPHDGRAELDWEDRIEIKLVSVWRAPDGMLACDKLKVCDVAVDPWRKLSNVLFVFVDRLTRVVAGAAQWHLGGVGRAELEASWQADPHFDQPALFVEAREYRGRSAPAYYVSNRWLSQAGIVPPTLPGVFSFDAKWWSEARREHGADPLATVIDGGSERVICPRCGGPLRVDLERVQVDGWCPAWHGTPLGERCAVRGHFAVRSDRLHPGWVLAPDEFVAGLEGRVPPATVWRLADRVPEPDDHLH